VLLEETCADAENPASEHDFGHDILPRIIKGLPSSAKSPLGAPDKSGRAVFAYDFRENRVPGDLQLSTSNSQTTAACLSRPIGTSCKLEVIPYWRDVGTIDAYWEANMDLRAASPVFNLYNREWPVRTADFWNPPAKFVHEAGDRIGRAINSLVPDGCIISGATVRGSILGRQVFVHSYAEVTDCVVLDGVDIGGGAKLHRAIVDENVRIPPGTVIGYNLEEDRKHFCVSEGGVVVITRADFHPVPIPTLSGDPAPQPVG